jgi:hypothetical protein
VRVADSRRQKGIVTLERISKKERNRCKQDRQKRIFVEIITANTLKYLVIPSAKHCIHFRGICMDFYKSLLMFSFVTINEFPVYERW